MSLLHFMLLQNAIQNSNQGKDMTYIDPNSGLGQFMQYFVWGGIILIGAFFLFVIAIVLWSWFDDLYDKHKRYKRNKK